MGFAKFIYKTNAFQYTCPHCSADLYANKTTWAIFLFALFLCALFLISFSIPGFSSLVKAHWIIVILIGVGISVLSACLSWIFGKYKISNDLPTRVNMCCPSCGKKLMGFVKFLSGLNMIRFTCPHCNIRLKANKITWTFFLLSIVLYGLFIILLCSKYFLSIGSVFIVLVCIFLFCTVMQWFFGGFLPKIK